ncbi:hypothetical protein ACFOQM_23470 [Paenibacillus sp. GCM10012307]|uniref:Uncharacterized protein n=1 Tax=Paenibacillus roseus TaxID=2798579 RepID=A0A934J6H9_9BACL|nr:hypothetical protein [Paenibacillus roseus]MBJ6364184.1 hypothetical protein [Paenibacillus roseus]
MNKVLKHISTYNPRDLDHMTLTLRVIEDGGVTVILGVDPSNGRIYVIDVKGVLI